MLSGFALLGFGFTSVIVTLTRATVSLSFNAFARSCKAFSMPCSSIAFYLLSDLDATDEEVIAAAKAACADHFIRTLPGGYQMELNEDASNVSQGQKQLLTIARAILADNKILILDEATSSVDTRTEQRIQTAMDNLMRGRTSFVIAHRLSTIVDADQIVVVNDGCIEATGTQAELLQACPLYETLWNAHIASRDSAEGGADRA